MLKIKLIVGSIREVRQGKKVADWATSLYSQNSEIELEVLDLKELDLPYDLNHDHPKAKSWSEKINEADGYILVTPEYNHGYTAPVKNALDLCEEEWHKKPIGLIGYSSGQMGGGRVIEHLKPVLHELQLIVLPETIYIPKVKEAFNEEGKPINEHLEQNLQNQIDQLIWWGKLLSDARKSP